MKNILDQALNRVTIIGKLLDVSFGQGTTKNGGAPYERATVNVRVTQTYGGQTETSEIPVSMFATQYTSKGSINPAWKSIQDLKEMKTAQNVGFDEADTVRFAASGTSLRENNFVSKSGQLINTWQIGGSFVNKVSLADTASFNIDIFIMDMKPETTRDGDPTGRLIIKGGIVQYNGKLDVVEFIVEGPEQVEYIERNWEENTTVNVQGRVRITTVEDKHSGHSGSWGEEVPEESTRIVRELIITTGDDQPKDEEFAYDPVDIKKAFAARKAVIEQLQIDAKNNGAKNNAGTPAQATSKYSWE